MPPVNTFLNIDMVTLEALAVLENELTFTRQIPRKYDDYFADSGAKIGDRLRVRKPIRNRVRVGQGWQPQAIQEQYVDVVLTTQAGVDCEFSTADLTLKIDEFSDRILAPQIAQIANFVDDQGLQIAILTNMAIGTPGVAITTPLPYLTAGAKMKEAAAPVGRDWKTVINPAQSVAIVNGLTTYFNPVAEISSQYKKGVMGRAFGFEWYEDQNVFTHTVGALGASTPIVTTGNQSGSTINTSGWAAGAVLNKGDVIQFTGVNMVNPQNYRTTGRLMDFVVTAQAVADGGGLMAIPIYPPLVPPSVTPTPDPYQNVTGSPAPSAPVFVFNVAAAQFSTIASKDTPTGLSFVPEFATLVAADLYQPKGVDMASRKQDDQVGLSIRYIRAYDAITDQLISRFDILFGWALLRWELACRIQT
jgi:hypothetical protein